MTYEAFCKRIKEELKNDMRPTEIWVESETINDLLVESKKVTVDGLKINITFKDENVLSLIWGGSDWLINHFVDYNYNPNEEFESAVII